MKDGYGDSVSVCKDDDLLLLGKMPCGEWAVICSDTPIGRPE